MSPKRKKPRIGDVVRIATPDGAAWAQYTHRHPEFGAVVRVLGPAPTQGDDPPDPTGIAAKPTQFVALFPLGPACYRGIAEIIGPGPIPDAESEFPRFRQALRLDPQSTAPCNWLIWDGEHEWVIPRLAEEQRGYPIRAIINDTLLVERALQGWRSEQVL